ncbi:GntR family transcriptional regulator [Parasphingorhabdus flavimaris]|jgi:DNA-binding GntR family transcriptional regulator|uniref:GntR family transcriptional regulator n=1 Tax=Parasphingorhabdus flavimaris TaxID=266812 RepID=A0ABX2N5L0_9SPHN|nr:GntR family transcriptional regulator [Parasphingorhabdus flavimaris]NVD28972.1 GntR family transcriptional regulator [Parasphingorhabdus flavimaris]|tara:strand:+ start:6839 stop:7492 length:654 start_codon:yes stop_codon:yes gene_type:complete
MSRASDTAYEKIRSFILYGEAHPGMQLTEERLSEISGVSRTPVRDAVQRLENEMLLVRSASKRLSVADWSDDEIDEMFTLRAMLESHAAERAAQRMDGDSLVRLREINEILTEAVNRPKPDIGTFLDANRQFHDLILACAQSPRLSKLLPALVEQPVVRRTANHYSQEDLVQSGLDHDELIAAFTARDQVWAGAVMTSHIRRAFHSFSSASARTVED